MYMNTNRAVIIGMVVFWAIAVALMVAGLLSYENNKVTGAGNGSGNRVQGTSEVNPSTGAEAGALTLSVVAQHALESDCWMVISGSVYDVTAYIPMHPGGRNEIIKYCGKNATEAFGTKDKLFPQDHSAFAYALLDKYLVGVIGDPLDGALQSVEQPSDTVGQTESLPVTQSTSNTQVGEASQTETVANTTLTASEVSLHSSEASCWMIVRGKVYDVTAYIPMHPGGRQRILNYCGKDGGAAFDAAGHSSFARNLLEKYYIGDVGAIVATDQTTTTQTGTDSGIPAVSDTIEAQFPGATIVKTEFEDNGVQKVVLRYDGEKYEVLVGVDGTILKVEEDD
jgi:cytochrome b involved in lipid metabolism